MINLTLAAAAQITGAEMIGDDVNFLGCSTDSRKVESGQMFIALRGEKFDGHDFITEAIRQGANCVMSERTAPASLSALRVKDSIVALGKLASSWRAKLALPLIAITGSNGKTTVKEMLASILSKRSPVLATTGNLNNDIGVPLMLFKLSDKHKYAVIEIGASKAGEVLRLAKISQPNVALITNCAAAHLEGFGSIDKIATAKAEIYSRLNRDGIAIINADDRFFDYWQRLSSSSRQLSFGLAKAADVTAKDICQDHNNLSTTFKLILPSSEISVRLPLLGRHNVMNALAASASALAVDIEAAQIKAGLDSVESVAGRLQFKCCYKGAKLIDDTYNANPASFSSAIEVLQHCKGRKWVVLGDMMQLGEQAKKFHYEAGLLASRSGIEKMFTMGTLSYEAGNGFGATTRHFDTHGQIIEYLHKNLSADVTLLVKGSRYMAMDKIVRALEGKS